MSQRCAYVFPPVNPRAGATCGETEETHRFAHVGHAFVPPHPSAEDIAAAADNTASDEDQRTVFAHVALCDECRADFFAARRSGTEVAS